MTFTGFIKRIVLIALLTWIIFSFTSNLASALFFALMPLFYYEALRPR